MDLLGKGCNHTKKQSFCEALPFLEVEVTVIFAWLFDEQSLR